MGDHHALHSGHHAQAGQDAGANSELAAPACQRGKFEEGAIRVEQQLEALPDEQSAPLVVATGIADAAARPDQLELRFQRVQRVELHLPVVAVGVVARVEGGSQNGRRRLLSLARLRPTRASAPV